MSKSFRSFFMSSMTWTLFLALFISYHCSFTEGTDASIQLIDDVLGLIVFKSGLHDPNQSLDSWNEDDNSPCSWKHVKCDPSNGLVSEISLDGLGLSGKIGKGLEKLQNLQTLSLTGNKFSGSLTEDIARIDSLRNLNLSRNAFTGVIPAAYGAMKSIRSLDFSENSFSGTIPEYLFDSCSTIRFISLGGNSFRGSLPVTLGKCVALGGLNVSGNRLSGPPDFVGGLWMLKNLRLLDISMNQFTGTISAGISGLHNLKELYLYKNHFSGPIPFDVGLCIHLNRIDLSENSFSGEIPITIQRISFLSYVNLSKNRLTGSMPLWISSISNIQYLDFSFNRMIGSIPDSIGDLKLIKYLGFAVNRLSGRIPDRIIECTQLVTINLKGNMLNGSIPSGLFELGLKEIDLSDNSLSGTIPIGSTQLFESLRKLDLSNNSLTGEVPLEMSFYFELEYLNLSWNHLHYRLPPELGELKSLSQIDLRNSGLYGMLPSELCDANSLTVLQLDGNSLAGSIPAELGNCSSLRFLGLSHNSLSGFIPKELSKLNNLFMLNLAYNSLTGQVPQELAGMDNLLLVNISHNRLTGRLPKGSVFQNLDDSAIEGNPSLCSPKLLRCQMNIPKPLALNPGDYGRGNGGEGGSFGEVSEPGNVLNSRHRRFLTVSATIAICAAGVIALGVVMVTLLNIKVKKKDESIIGPTNVSESFSSSSPKSSTAMGKLVLFSSTSDSSSTDWVNNAESLLNKASEIGRGVFGTVYRATVADGRAIAIKKLVTSIIVQSQDDFDREVQVLGKARHPNLISLKGYYWTTQFQLLISEYGVNGSLHERLHENSAGRWPPLSWVERLRIVLGTAKGLAHLHQSFRPPIIHYNIKPSNILLDEDLNPKISDFGLARLIPKLDKHILSSRFQSALGYVAPELACQSLRINEKCDVYGFGVLVLELVTGRRAVEYGEDDVIILSDHVKLLIEQGNTLGCVDRSMGSFPEEEVLPVLKLGLVCTSQIPSSRPCMGEVVQILQVIKTPLSDRMEEPF